jgi:predicted PurR-regulated permease PerM
MQPTAQAVGESGRRRAPAGRKISSHAHTRGPIHRVGCGIGLVTCIRDDVSFGEHVRITRGALKNWAIAQMQDSLAVAALWLIGLYALKVPWAPLWALLAACLQVIPHLGPVLGLIGPVLAATLRWGDWEHPLYVLMLYAGIAVVDGFLLQPYIMKRVARVPMWASLLTPIVLGILIPFWGVLLAPPLLAVVYAYKAWHEKQKLPAERSF